MTVQDEGRPGYAHLGVPHSGAAVVPALRLANRLVGNADGAAALEVALTGCEIELTEGRFVAVTGAPSEVRVAGAHGSTRVVDQGVAVYVSAGGRVIVGAARAGVYRYVAVAGGVDVAAELGSRATDLLGGLGPAPLRAGDRVALGAATGAPSAVDVAPEEWPEAELTLRVTLGPREDWFAPAAIHRLWTEAYAVTPTSNRIGLRLTGPPLARTDEASMQELPSEGMVAGALQVPPNGLPVLFLADHPTTGGYPVIACVHPADIARAAQAAPGTVLRFTGMGFTGLRPTAPRPTAPPFTRG
jgi:biotin-dependent carboxylase-like uncharacterized protein